MIKLTKYLKPYILLIIVAIALKPIGATVQEVDELIRTTEKTGKKMNRKIKTGCKILESKFNLKPAL